MSDFEIVIVGGGLTSARAIKAYREAGGEGRIALVSRDDTVPYHRPPLSKRYLRGEQERQQTFVEPESFYPENDVELLLETTANRVLAGERTVELEGGGRVRYEKLLVASGAVPRRPGVPGADLEGVFTLRWLRDSTAIREAATEAGDAVTVGASFIGMEVTASLRALRVPVTLVARGDSLFPVLAAPEVSRDLIGLYRENGVEVVLGDSLAACHGNARLEQVETARGLMLECGLCVAGIGVTTSVSFLEGSGVEVGDGVVVNERFETGVPGIWAAGDVASFYDPVFGRRRRIEHWSNANYQGAQVGKVLAGEDAPYGVVSTFFSEVFGVVIKVFGDSSRHDELVMRGSLAERDVIGFYLENGRLAATVLSGQDEATETRLKELIEAGATPADRDRLADRSVPLEELFAAPAV